MILKRLYASEAEKCFVDIPIYLHLLHSFAALMLISWDSAFMNQIKQFSTFIQGIKLIPECGRASISSAQCCHSRYLTGSSSTPLPCCQLCVLAALFAPAQGLCFLPGELVQGLNQQNSLQKHMKMLLLG